MTPTGRNASHESGNATAAGAVGSGVDVADGSGAGGDASGDEDALVPGADSAVHPTDVSSMSALNDNAPSRVAG